ncbi:MAG: hypothetical protein FJW26_09245 [Acidimicrobiia bacterium]|nr:hypothetical protein [Acidimicrobiia bacterium]
MPSTRHFSKAYFEHDFPRLQKLVDRKGRPLSVILTLEGGHRIELRDFKLTLVGLVVTLSSGEYSIPFQTIQSVQFVPQAKKSLLLNGAGVAAATLRS